MHKMERERSFIIISHFKAHTGVALKMCAGDIYKTGCVLVLKARAHSETSAGKWNNLRVLPHLVWLVLYCYPMS